MPILLIQVLFFPIQAFTTISITTTVGTSFGYLESIITISAPILSITKATIAFQQYSSLYEPSLPIW